MLLFLSSCHLKWRITLIGVLFIGLVSDSTQSALPGKTVRSGDDLNLQFCDKPDDFPNKILSIGGWQDGIQPLLITTDLDVYRFNLEKGQLQLTESKKLESMYPELTNNEAFKKASLNKTFVNTVINANSTSKTTDLSFVVKVGKDDIYKIVTQNSLEPKPTEKELFTSKHEILTKDAVWIGSSFNKFMAVQVNDKKNNTIWAINLIPNNDLVNYIESSTLYIMCRCQKNSDKGIKFENKPCDEPFQVKLYKGFFDATNVFLLGEGKVYAFNKSALPTEDAKYNEQLGSATLTEIDYKSFLACSGIHPDVETTKAGNGSEHNSTGHHVSGYTHDDGHTGSTTDNLFGLPRVYVIVGLTIISLVCLIFVVSAVSCCVGCCCCGCGENSKDSTKSSAKSHRRSSRKKSAKKKRSAKKSTKKKKTTRKASVQTVQTVQTVPSKSVSQSKGPRKEVSVGQAPSALTSLGPVSANASQSGRNTTGSKTTSRHGPSAGQLAANSGNKSSRRHSSSTAHSRALSAMPSLNKKDPNSRKA